MEDLAKLIDVLEETCHSINVDEEPYNGEYSVELGFMTDLGEEFIVSFWFDGTQAGFCDEMQSYANDFDPEEHATMWYDARNSVRGVPQSLTDLLKDAKRAKKTLNEMSSNLNEVLLRGKKKRTRKADTPEGIHDAIEETLKKYKVGKVSRDDMYLLLLKIHEKWDIITGEA